VKGAPPAATAADRQVAARAWMTETSSDANTNSVVSGLAFLYAPYVSLWDDSATYQHLRWCYPGWPDVQRAWLLYVSAACATARTHSSSDHGPEMRPRSRNPKCFFLVRSGRSWTHYMQPAGSAHCTRTRHQKLPSTGAWTDAKRSPTLMVCNGLKSPGGPLSKLILLEDRYCYVSLAPPNVPVHR
jgi:hypothetical protein